MKFGNLSVLGLVLVSTSAMALERIEKPYQAFCSGTQGYIKVTAYPVQDFLSFEVATAQGKIVDTISSKTAPLPRYFPSVSIYSFENPTHSQWINLNGSKLEKRLVPAHEECTPTRVHGRCFKHIVPARIHNITKQSLGLQLRMLGNGKVAFSMIDSTGYPIPRTAPLGQNVSCQLIAL